MTWSQEGTNIFGNKVKDNLLVPWKYSSDYYNWNGAIRTSPRPFSITCDRMQQLLCREISSPSPSHPSRSVCHWELTGKLTSFLAQARGHVVLQLAQRGRLEGLKVDLNLVRIRIPQRRLPVLDYVHHTAQLISCNNHNSQTKKARISDKQQFSNDSSATH